MGVLEAMSPDNQPSIVVIDDDEELLGKLRDALENDLVNDGVVVRTWKPDEGENPVEEFGRLVDEDTVLVVTDYDLTKNGMTGMFGVSIVSWCQARSIPVGDFSRANLTTLPKEPALFELRVPSDIDEAARYSTTMFRGFRTLRDELAGDAVDLNAARSPAQVLAAVLGRPQQESQFALYMSLLGAANASLLDNLRAALDPNEVVSTTEKERLLAYVLGHVLANAVLRYPGPILSEAALCAYVATTKDEAAAVGGLFRDALYGGPFSVGANYYWRADVDGVIERESAAIAEGASFDSSGGFNRAVAEKVLDRPLAKHECTRCGGVDGGYLCPFTGRAVCERGDCSVAANSWIPAGADAARIERDFYEEWAPLLGL
jgi:hypothetical protein